MKQLGLGLNLSTKKTRKREFLEEMDRVVPWAALVEIVQPHYPRAKTGRPPFALETMLRIHYLQQWFGLSDPAMEEALHDVPLYREFARLDGATQRLPDETTILRFRHLLERHDLAADMLRLVADLLQHKGLMLRTGTVVDATLIAAPSSTKNAEGERVSCCADARRRGASSGQALHWGRQLGLYGTTDNEATPHIEANLRHRRDNSIGWCATRHAGHATSRQRMCVEEC
ncbi:MAG: IS5 family transposase [Rubrivivax sp.]